MVKLIIYIIVIPLVVFSMDSVNLNSFFKKGQSNYYQARVFYVLLVMALSYLVVNLVVDFLGVFS